MSDKLPPIDDKGGPPPGGQQQARRSTLQPDSKREPQGPVNSFNGGATTHQQLGSEPSHFQPNGVARRPTLRPGDPGHLPTMETAPSRRQHRGARELQQQLAQRMQQQIEAQAQRSQADAAMHKRARLTMDAIGIGKKNDLDDAAKDREIAKLIQQYDGPEDKQELMKQVMDKVRITLQRMQMRPVGRTSKIAVSEQQQPQQAGSGAAASSSSATGQQQTEVKLPPIKPPGEKK